MTNKNLKRFLKFPSKEKLIAGKFIVCIEVRFVHTYQPDRRSGDTPIRETAPVALVGIQDSPGADQTCGHPQRSTRL